MILLPLRRHTNILGLNIAIKDLLHLVLNSLSFFRWETVKVSIVHLFHHIQLTGDRAFDRRPLHLHLNTRILLDDIQRRGRLTISHPRCILWVNLEILQLIVRLVFLHSWRVTILELFGRLPCRGIIYGLLLCDSARWFFFVALEFDDAFWGLRSLLSEFRRADILPCFRVVH